MPVHIVSRDNRLIALALTLAVVLSVALACAPTSGASIGDTPPEFTIQLADGSQVSSVALINENQPAHLFYFATW